MRKFGKLLGRFILSVIFIVVLGVAALFLFGAKEPVSVVAHFDDAKFGEGVQVYLESVEAQYSDITPGVEKRVIWHGAHETRTPVSVLYVHGFSATSEELRPVPDLIAAQLKANLVFTRLAGHGRPGREMGRVTVADWMADMAEALAVARAVGDKVLVISTSTGGTLVAEALLQKEMRAGVYGTVFISPNFGINDPMAGLLTVPGMRTVLPYIVGETRKYEPSSRAQGTYWTTSYPTVSALPLAALVRHAVAQNYADVDIPALFYFSPGDRVVRADKTEIFAANWGGDTRVSLVPDTADVTQSRHVIAGDIASPGHTDATVQIINEWLEGL